jgi:hypothetical protein
MRSPRSYMTKPQSRLDYDPVLEKGYVVYARATTHGLHIVTIEDPVAIYSQTDSQASKRAEQIAVGKSFNIEHAFKLALAAFNNGLSHDEMYKRDIKKPKFLGTAKKPLSILDNWVLSHHFSMRILHDFDGSTICIVEGWKDPLTRLEQITLQGVGHSLRSALNDAFSEIKLAKTSLANPA